jgi:hypothetical protein
MDEHQHTQLDRLEDSLLRVESKLDAFGQRLMATETDLGWLKASAKWGVAILMAVVGKLAHLTFFQPK